jgi:hypothetical protein
VVELDRDTASRLGVATGDRVMLHFPISDAGQLEAKRLAPGSSPVVETPSWIRTVAVADPAERIAQLVEAARAGAVDPCLWPPAAMLIGGYPFDGVAPPLELGPPPPRVDAAPELNENLARSLDELELSVRTANALQTARLTTIRELVQCSEGDLLKLPGFARQSLKEVKEILAEMGLGLGMRL